MVNDVAKMKFLVRNRAFSLVEVVIAASILAMASLSVFQLFIFTTKSTRAIYNNSIALNLARTAIEQVEILGASKFPAASVSEVVTDRNKFVLETKIVKLSRVFSSVEVVARYKESGRDVKVPLMMLVEN